MKQRYFTIKLNLQTVICRRFVLQIKLPRPRKKKATSTNDTNIGIFFKHKKRIKKKTYVLYLL